LAEINAAEVNSDILASVKTSNDSHATHAAALAESKSSYDAYTASLAELKTANISSGILESVMASNEAHATQAKAFPEIESASIQPNILAAVQSSNETLASQSAMITELNAIVATPALAAEKVDLSPLSAKLDEHSPHLIEIKSVIIATASVPEKVDLSTIETSVTRVGLLYHWVFSVHGLEYVHSAPPKYEFPGSSTENKVECFLLYLSIKKEHGFYNLEIFNEKLKRE